jgi:hypothetical protein
METEKVFQMLRIIEICRGYPNLRPIHDFCMKKLEEVAKSLANPPVPSKPTPQPEPEPNPEPGPAPTHPQRRV